MTSLPSIYWYIIINSAEIQACTHTCACTNTHTHTYMCMHAHTHIHVHAHTQNLFNNSHTNGKLTKSNLKLIQLRVIFMVDSTKDIRKYKRTFNVVQTYSVQCIFVILTFLVLLKLLCDQLVNFKRRSLFALAFNARRRYGAQFLVQANREQDIG